MPHELNQRSNAGGFSSLGFLVAHFLTVRDQTKSKEFYVGILGGKIVKEENPCYIKLADSWIILNSGGGPTPDKRHRCANNCAGWEQEYAAYRRARWRAALL